jgi:hypothetical protein
MVTIQLHPLQGFHALFKTELQPLKNLVGVSFALPCMTRLYSPFVPLCPLK